MTNNLIKGLYCYNTLFTTVHAKTLIMKFSLSLISLVVIIFTFSACQKNPGPGGSSNIIGKIHAEVYDGANNLLYEYDVPKEDVYIIYGEDETTFHDDVETSYDGTFRFEYMETGKYQVFVYTKCTSCPGGKDVIIEDVEITEKKSTIDLGTITIVKGS